MFLNVETEKDHSLNMNERSDPHFFFKSSASDILFSGFTVTKKWGKYMRNLKEQLCMMLSPLSTRPHQTGLIQ